MRFITFWSCHFVEDFNCLSWFQGAIPCVRSPRVLDRECRIKTKGIQFLHQIDRIDERNLQSSLIRNK